MGNASKKQVQAILRRVIDRVEQRRFGLRHDKPCKDPTVLSCADRKCQRANACQYQDHLEKLLGE